MTRLWLWYPACLLWCPPSASSSPPSPCSSRETAEGLSVSTINYYLLRCVASLNEILFSLFPWDTFVQIRIRIRDKGILGDLTIFFSALNEFLFLISQNKFLILTKQRRLRIFYSCRTIFKRCQEKKYNFFCYFFSLFFKKEK